MSSLMASNNTIRFKKDALLEGAVGADPLCPYSTTFEDANLAQSFRYYPDCLMALLDAIGLVALLFVYYGYATNRIMIVTIPLSISQMFSTFVSYIKYFVFKPYQGDLPKDVSRENAPRKNRWAIVFPGLLQILSFYLFASFTFSCQRSLDAIDSPMALFHLYYDNDSPVSLLEYFSWHKLCDIVVLSAALVCIPIVTYFNYSSGSDENNRKKPKAVGFSMVGYLVDSLGLLTLLLVSRILSPTPYLFCHHVLWRFLYFFTAAISARVLLLVISMTYFEPSGTPYERFISSHDDGASGILRSYWHILLLFGMIATVVLREYGFGAAKMYPVLLIGLILVVRLLNVALNAGHISGLINKKA